MELKDSAQKRIAEILKADSVVLFMKGSRDMPQCGFSAQVVEILDRLLPSYGTVDVLSAPELRDAIKAFADWPTIPQLYINGSFIGGCDIVREMHASGELQRLLKSSVAEPEIPSIVVSDAAAAAVRQAGTDAGDEELHLQVSATFEYDLYFGPRADGEIAVHANGLTLLLDPTSARRARGVRIDFIEGANAGFKITNPNEPPHVVQLDATELKALLDRHEIVLFDVRPDEERSVAKIDLAKPLDSAGQEYLFSLEPNVPIALHCHHGARSQQAALQLLQEGFRKVYNLRGGIDAWSLLVDPAVPRY
jgi:monothiol glutaredoxin